MCRASLRFGELLLYTLALGLLVFNAPVRGFRKYERGERGIAVVIDAGSTGSRATIFDLVLDRDREDDETLYPKVLLPIKDNKVRYPLVNRLRMYFQHLEMQCCGDEREAEEHSGLLNHFNQLREYVDAHVDPKHRSSTVILVRGTAGFRLLDEETLERYHRKVDEMLRKEFSSYAVTPDSFMVYSGAEEAAAGFIALRALVASDCLDDLFNDVVHEGLVAHYLSSLSRDDTGLARCNRHKPLFMFEVGGSSAQIAAELADTSHRSFAKLQEPELCGFVQVSAVDPLMSLVKYKERRVALVLHSFLGQGRSMAMMNYLRTLEAPGEKRVAAACLPRGLSVEVIEDVTVVLNQLVVRDPDTYTGSSTLALGASDYETCRLQVEKLVHNTLKGDRMDHPADVYLYGTENFIYLLSDMKISVDGTFKVTPRVLLDLARQVCPMERLPLEDSLARRTTAEHLCFGLTFLATLSKAVLGLADDADIIVKQRIHNTSPSWTLGTVLLELPHILRGVYAKHGAGPPFSEEL